MIQNQDLTSLNPAAFLADVQHSSSSTILVTGAAAITALAAIAYAAKCRKQSAENSNKDLAPRFTNENITASFVAAIPTITRQLNLELATAHQTETFTRSSAKSILWGMVDLGTNTAQIRVPVTYRYNICLRDKWELRIHGDSVTVRAPVLRASLPAAIHSDGVERMSVRGWCRGSPRDLLADLERQLTPALSEFANNPKQLSQVRETCRLSVAEFVRLWLERERQWGQGGFRAIQVQFADEAALPSEPTVKRLL